MRIAFAGASGTGKSTLAKYVADTYGVPVNPVGSRSTAAAMGFASPYDVDAVGRRAEFQHRLTRMKSEWEAANPAFVSDRTTVDNLVYLALHDVHAIDGDVMNTIVEGFVRYTHVFYCPMSEFQNVGDDPARVRDNRAYHQVFDAMLRGMLGQLSDRVVWVLGSDLAARKRCVDRALGSGSGRNMRGIYVASKVKHAPMWRAMRAGGAPITSTWIDYEDTVNTADLWARCIDEASAAGALVVYRADVSEELKGVLTEVGAALARGRRVYWVGPVETMTGSRYSCVDHPHVARCSSLQDAMARAYAATP